MGYASLANAVIEQAAKEYRSALYFLKRHPENKSAMEAAMNLEKFFHSEWYGILTDVDPDYLIGRLRREAAK